jgi:homoserine O-acetyltransferase
VITVADMVRTERAFLDVLGIERLAAVAGGSLGGMQALQWAVLFPDQVDAIVSIASTHALHPQGLAWNSIARDSIMRDQAWQGGRYYGTGRAPDAGMGVARMVGHITYLSAQGLEAKFGRRLQRPAAGTEHGLPAEGSAPYGERPPRGAASASERAQARSGRAAGAPRDEGPSQAKPGVTASTGAGPGGSKGGEAPLGSTAPLGDTDIRYTLTEAEFEVESYLRHQADSFVRRFDANTYLYTSRALTYFDLARQHGGGSLERALAGVRARTLLIAFSSDWLYPPSGSREIADALAALGQPAELHVIDAPYGHDCFLLEEARQTPLIRGFLVAGEADGPVR